MPRDVSDDNLPHAFCVLILQREKREKGGEGGKRWWGEAGQASDQPSSLENEFGRRRSLGRRGHDQSLGSCSKHRSCSPPGRLLLLGRRTWWCCVDMRAVEGGC